MKMISYVARAAAGHQLWMTNDARDDSRLLTSGRNSLLRRTKNPTPAYCRDVKTENQLNPPPTVAAFARSLTARPYLWLIRGSVKIGVESVKAS